MRHALLYVALTAAAACGGSSKPAATTPAPAATGSITPAAPGTASPASPAAPLAKATRIRSVEGITEYRLGNGLQVLLFPDDTQSTVTVNVTYLVGSRHEGYGETGMAHLLEHMLFKGTPRHRNVMKLLEGRGAQFNGTTWTDRTNYYETLPAEGDNLAFALGLEADRMVNASILEDDLRTEFSVVRNEFEMSENEPSAILAERIESTAFLWHNYGKSTIGARSDIERVPVPALRAFYQKFYQPDNATLVVAGKFTEAEALALVEKTFGAVPKAARTLPPTYTTEPQQDGERTVTLRRNGDIAVLGVVYHTVGAAAPDYPAVVAALDLLDREPSGRLYRKLVTNRLASSVEASQTMFKDPYLAGVYAELRDPKNIDKVEKIVFDEIEKLGASKIDPKELERWRVETLKNIELAFTDSTQLAVALSTFVAIGDWRAIFAHRNRVEKVTAADVARVAKTYFKASNRTSGRFLPTKDADRAPLVESPDIAVRVTGIESGDVKDKGEAFAATLDNIEARTARSKLASGIKTAFLPKKTRGGKVKLLLSMHWGDEKGLQGKQVVAELAAELLQRGTMKRSYEQLRDDENLLRARIYLMGGATGWTLGIDALRDKLPAAIDLAAEMLRSPSFPAKELEVIKQETIAQLEAQLQDPQAIAYVTLQQLSEQWPKADPRYSLTPQEQIDLVKKVTLADIKAFYKDFVGTRHAELAVVGDFDPAAIGAQVEAKLGNWGTTKPYAKLLEKVWNLPGQQKSIQIKDKEMSMLALGHDLVMKDSDPDYAAWLLVGQIVGGDTGSRIWMRLREKEGLSYGAGAWTYADADGEKGGVGGYAIVAPQNLEKARASLLDELTKMTTGPVTEDELARAKATWTKSDDTNLSDDDWVAASLASQLFRDRTMAWRKDLRAKVAAVTAADVARVAKKHLQPGRLLVIDAGDSTKVAPTK